MTLSSGFMESTLLKQTLRFVTNIFFYLPFALIFLNSGTIRRRYRPAVSLQFEPAADVGGGANLGKPTHGTTSQRLSRDDPYSLRRVIHPSRLCQRFAIFHNARLSSSGLGTPSLGPAAYLASDASYEKGSDGVSSPISRPSSHAQYD